LLCHEIGRRGHGLKESRPRRKQLQRNTGDYVSTDDQIRTHAAAPTSMRFGEARQPHSIPPVQPRQKSRADDKPVAGLSMTRLDYAKEYLSRGYTPLPVPLKSKNPGFEGWQNYNPVNGQFERDFDGEGNIGLLLGAP